jgi:hypothetical protein
MSTQAAVSGNTTKNNGGTIKKAGNANTTTGPITVSRTLMQDAKATPYGAQVALSSGSAGSSGNVGTHNAITGGTFKYQMVAGRYIMKKNTSYVNGSANTLLTSCAGDVGIRRSIPKLENTRVYGSGYLTSWDYETGAITKGANKGQVAAFGNDVAARPTNAAPGALTYKTGAKLPVEDDYKPKYSS